MAMNKRRRQAARYQGPGQWYSQAAAANGDLSPITDHTTDCGGVDLTPGDGGSCDSGGSDVGGDSGGGGDCGGGDCGGGD